MTRAETTLLVTIGVLLVLAGGISFFGIRPLWGRLSRLQAERQQTAKELSELEERADILGKLAKDEGEVKEFGRRALIYLPTTVAASPFVMDVAAIGGVAGTNVPTLTFQSSDPKKSPGGNVSEFPITMSVEGSYDQLKTFLRSLEENLRFSTFTSLTIAQLPDRLSLQLTGGIYSKAEDPNPKDKSLTIDESMKKLLTGRKTFGAKVETSGPGRPDPFAGL
jgi:Tfp pilus assembly protein PilO